MSRTNIHLKNQTTHSIVMSSWRGKEARGEMRVDIIGGTIAPGQTRLIGSVGDPGWIGGANVGEFYFRLNDTIFEGGVRKVTGENPSVCMNYAPQTYDSDRVDRPVFTGHWHNEHWSEGGDDSHATTLVVRQAPMQEGHLSGWMGASYEAIKTKPLNRLWIPGSHDTGTYGAHPNKFASGFVRAQQVSTYDQLKLGVRYLDIRARLEDGEWKTYHGGYKAEPLANVLSDIARFLSEYDWEVVLLDFSHLWWMKDNHQDPDETNHDVALVNFYEEYLKKYKLNARNLSPNSTIAEIAANGGWADRDTQNGNLIILYPKNNELPHDPGFYDHWVRDDVFDINSPNANGDKWYDTLNFDTLLSGLKEDTNPATHPPTRGLYISQIQGTPQSGELMTCWDLAKSFNAKFGMAFNQVYFHNKDAQPAQVNDLAARTPNILLQDYVDMGSLASLCMELNTMAVLYEYSTGSLISPRYKYSLSANPDHQGEGWNLVKPILFGYPPEALDWPSSAPRSVLPPLTAIYEYVKPGADGYHFIYSQMPDHDFGPEWQVPAGPAFLSPANGLSSIFSDLSGATGRLSTYHHGGLTEISSGISAT